MKTLCVEGLIEDFLCGFVAWSWLTLRSYLKVVGEKYCGSNYSSVVNKHESVR